MRLALISSLLTFTLVGCGDSGNSPNSDIFPNKATGNLTMEQAAMLIAKDRRDSSTLDFLDLATETPSLANPTKQSVRALAASDTNCVTKVTRGSEVDADSDTIFASYAGERVCTNESTVADQQKDKQIRTSSIDVVDENDMDPLSGYELVKTGATRKENSANTATALKNKKALVQGLPVSNSSSEEAYSRVSVRRADVPKDELEKIAEANRGSAARYSIKMERWTRFNAVDGSAKNAKSIGRVISGTLIPFENNPKSSSGQIKGLKGQVAFKNSVTNEIISLDLSSDAMTYSSSSSRFQTGKLNLTDGAGNVVSIQFSNGSPTFFYRAKGDKEEKEMTEALDKAEEALSKAN